MNVIAVMLMVAGAALAAAALAMDVSLPSEAFGGVAGERIANNDLLNQRLLFAVLGAGLWVSGWLALIASRLSPPAAKADEATSLSGQF
jgi:hypothetical protein